MGGACLTCAFTGGNGASVIIRSVLLVCFITVRQSSLVTQIEYISITSSMFRSWPTYVMGTKRNMSRIAFFTFVCVSLARIIRTCFYDSDNVHNITLL